MGSEEEVRVSLKNVYIFSFFRETPFHSVTTQMQAVVTIYYHCMVFRYFSLNLVAIVCVKTNVLLNWQKNAVTLRYNFSLSDCHFSLNFLEGEVTSS